MSSTAGRDDTAEAIVLFDGVCNLCAGSVKRLIPRDPHARLRFASLQSAAGSHLRTSFAIAESEDSMVAIVDGRAYLRSDAALRVLRVLGGPYLVAAVLLQLVPRPIRDAGYRFVASHRFRWFGERNECWVPNPTLRARFLLDG
jgi:predicted DCC family thiol-disulfide oxidoreductase YuxK